MKQYIGTKMIQAAPAIRFLLKSGENMIVEKDDKLAMDYAKAMIEDGEVIAWEEAYSVVYKDGYSSWSPAQVFEEAYRQTDGMNFGLAIEAAKQGKKIARSGWNGKSQYVELATGISYTNNAGEVVNAEHATIGNKALAFVGTSGVQMGWLASQADMLADDWYIVE